MGNGLFPLPQHRGPQPQLAFKTELCGCLSAEGHRRAHLVGRECLDCGRVGFRAPLATWSQLRLPLSQEQLHRWLLQRRATGHPQAGSGHLSLEEKKKEVLERLALVGSASPSRALLSEIAQVTQAAEEVPLGEGWQDRVSFILGPTWQGWCASWLTVTVKLRGSHF